MVSEVDKAWAAGIVDGEGCLSLHKNGARWFSARAEVVTTTPIMVEELQRWYGGNINSHQPKHKDGGKRKVLHSWALYGDKAAVFVRDIIPYLRNKKQQAEIFLTAHEFLVTTTDSASEDWRYETLRNYSQIIAALKRI